ncbi:GNAT family N-acetyltransferase [Hyunsoonleella ulvae]|uniref:GNAT family N-acetyltransferase n=1 Tax=Hyunsoonleella ulvae TaxID=2799948 RepID=UPI001939B807|nr:GNAT family N-acetyltransferase [Hyunsoonleella ulvae]
MSNFKVVRYSQQYFEAWNEFVINAKNATFLFNREFMEYHNKRFQDFSLLVFKDKKLVAIFPANKEKHTVYSHQGLSYGGLILPNSLSFESVLQVFSGLLKFLLENEVQKLVIKQIPKIYNSKYADELDYLVFILKAKLYRRDISMVISNQLKPNYSELRRREIKRATNSDLKLVSNDDFLPFWDFILKPNLKDTFGVDPVHSLSEINHLKEKFPNNITQYNVYDKKEILAGCTVFESKSVVHLQYISTKKNNKKGALSFLIHTLISDIYKDKKYFDFGISNENQGKNINLGLLNWKQSFGASALVHDFYEIETTNYKLLDNVFI